MVSAYAGVAPFETLWKRRTTLVLPGNTTVDVLSLPDLVAAKKTQKDKDWPMIRRLVEAHYFAHRSDPNRARVAFWLMELRTPELLIKIARQHERASRRFANSRPLLANALTGDPEDINRELAKEEAAERDKDRSYWLPLRKELEMLRRSRRGK